MSETSRPYTFDRVVRLVISTLGVLLAVWIIGLLRDVLLPFLVAWLIAYMLEPFVQYNKRLLRVRTRIVPIFLTLFETVLLMIALGVIFMPGIAAEMRQMAVTPPSRPPYRLFRRVCTIFCATRLTSRPLRRA